jgi:hypothetical protein
VSVLKAGSPAEDASPESFYILAPRNSSKTVFVLKGLIRRRERFLENTHCLRCNRALEPGHKSVALYLFAQTVGIKPRQKSTAHRISFCPQCSVSLAMGPSPGGRAQRCRMGHDPRPGWFRPCTEPGGLGESERSAGFAASHRNRWRPSFRSRRRVFRVLTSRWAWSREAVHLNAQRMILCSRVTFSPFPRSK